MTALARVTRAALAVERFRLGAGALPENLADVVPRYLDVLPEDPYDGNPLRYRKLDKGFVVYSIGKDGIDDGGEPQEARAKGDITFRVRR